MGKEKDGARPRRSHSKFWLVAILACAVFFAAGWFVGNAHQVASAPVPQPLRLSGYQFISPLLACNFSASGAVPEDQSLSSAITAVINEHIAAGDISKASTYFAEFGANRWSDTYEDEKYYPSSLGKIPIMMAYYELAESTPAILQEKILFPVGSPDLNDTQDITPPEAIVPGQSYTVDDLIGYMIKYSDNNAAQLLFENIDPSTLRGVYGQLQIPVNDDATIANLDFITPQQIAVLFRILYNATYLSRDYSEKALQLMSQSSFTQGIVAGVPASTTVSHKFGIVGIAAAGSTGANGAGVDTEHELHDCGIVYAPMNPYLLCVMTRGASSVPTMEDVIADISKTVWQNVEMAK